MDRGASKSRPPQGNRVNQPPLACPVPGSGTPFIDTVRNSPITVRNAPFGIASRGLSPRPGSLERVIDLRLLREDPDRVRASQRARGEDVALVDALLSADERRRSSGVRFDELRSEQKNLGKLIPKASGDEKAELLKKLV